MTSRAGVCECVWMQLQGTVHVTLLPLKACIFRCTSKLNLTDHGTCTYFCAEHRAAKYLIIVQLLDVTEEAS